MLSSCNHLLLITRIAIISAGVYPSLVIIAVGTFSLIVDDADRQASRKTLTGAVFGKRLYA
jgi:hypothetical protein